MSSSVIRSSKRGGGPPPRLSSERWDELLRELDRRVEELVQNKALWETGKTMYRCEALCPFWKNGVEHFEGEVLLLDKFCAESREQFGHVKILEEVKC